MAAGLTRTPAPPPRRRNRSTTPPGSRLAFEGRRRLQLRLLTALWVVIAAYFWVWWLLPVNRGPNGWTAALVLLPLGYMTTVLPSFYWYFVARARVPDHRPAPPGLRVAVITPCVPSSESIDVIERQMQALAALTYPCDAWILDEQDVPAVRAVAERHGVRHFTRKDVPEWNEPGPPFQAKTKAGNVNAWLDHVLRSGYEYDVFVQFDIDHRPVPGYLERTLGHFDDPSVGWVQAPSISGNLRSWTARGQAEQDTVLQGPLQMGFYGHSSTPFIIGSHTSYRMAAIEQIGGYQPTRAEDHLDTVVLASRGWRGVYVPEPIAVGDGPQSFATYLGQQFAWAYSMVQIFLGHTPRLLRHYAPRQAFQLLMTQSWYLLWSLSCLLLWAMPFVALHSGAVFSRIPISDFLLHYLPLLLAATLLWWWSRQLFHPRGVTLSWRAIVLEAARWPIVQWAVVNVLLRVTRPYMITPKGDRAEQLAPGLRVFFPYFLLAWLGTGAIAWYVFTDGPLPPAGYLWLAILNVIAMLNVVFAVTVVEIRERFGTGQLAHVLRRRAGTVALLLASNAALAVCIADASQLLELTLR